MTVVTLAVIVLDEAKVITVRTRCVGIFKIFAISDQSPLERVFSSMLSSDLMSDADGAVFDGATYD